MSTSHTHDPSIAGHDRPAARRSGLTGLLASAFPARSSAAPWHRRGSGLFLTFLLLVAAACESDPTGSGDPPDPPTMSHVGAVVNSVDLTLTIFPVDEPEEAVNVGLAPDGTPTGLSVEEELAVVPMGTMPAVAVVDLRDLTMMGTIPLPEGSGATGSAFLSESVALVANPGRNSVSVVDLTAGTAGEEVEVGTYPEEIVVFHERVFVVNAELGEDFTPERTGTVTVLDSETLLQVGEVELSGYNSSAAALGTDNRLYVVNSGTFGEGNGSLSVVEVGSMVEVEHHEGFGDFPGAIAIGPGGNVYVSSFAYGTAIWDPSTREFIRSPEDAVAPGGIPSTSGIAFDSEGRFYALTPDCQEPGTVNRLDRESLEVEREFTVGTCPTGIGFTRFADR